MTSSISLNLFGRDFLEDGSLKPEIIIPTESSELKVWIKEDAEIMKVRNIPYKCFIYNKISYKIRICFICNENSLCSLHGCPHGNRVCSCQSG